MNAEGLQTRRRIIERPRLTRLLDQSKARIIMLVAPAGYGKTTLARQWLAQANRRAAWYIGGPASADVAALAVGVADAAAQIIPGAGARVHRLLSATHSAEDDVDSLAQLLVEDLRNWPSGAWLVFDDYHFLSGHVPAERFVEHLVSSMPLRVMLTSRTRPSWSSARRLIYGEATQLGGPLLAMDSQEAAQLLADKPQAEVSALVAMADGWPAVLALAALREEAILPAQGVPSALFSYLADELYQAIPPALRRDVTTLALIPSITVETTTHAIGQNASLVLSTCSSLGILTREDDETFGLHPLLRTFFQHKFDPQDERSNLAVTRLLSYFTTKLLWDDAFTLLQAYPDKAAIVSLVHAALDDLLYNNRLSTLERWLSWAEREGFASPILSLAGAEVAVRQAMFANSEAMALEASRGLDQADPLLARALLIAGRAALLNSREGTALAHLDAARRAASNEDTLREVFWNLFVCALELESDAAESYFAQHERLVRGSPDDHIRLMAGRAHLAGRLGGVKQHLLSPTEAVDLVERVRDPIIRSSFLIRHSYMLVFCGRYEEALDLSAQHLDNLDEIRLTFPIPHALVVRAAAQLGIGDVDSCTASLDEARERIRARGDGYIEMNCRILEAKALAAQQDFRRALLTVPDGMPTTPNRALYGEYLALRGLLLACDGRHREAEREQRRAEALTAAPEARALVACSSAVTVAELHDGASLEVLRVALRRASGTENIDTLVAAYRAVPRLLPHLASIPGVDIASILLNAHDEHFAGLAGLPPFPLSRKATSALLSKREWEVYSLLAIGLSNREIAQRLFISEKTAKVHVGRILAKLKTRSRTEAAIKAVVTPEIRRLMPAMLPRGDSPVPPS